MATLSESSVFTSPVYLLERNDPYYGGALGTANKQAQQLANRTRYLLDRMLAEHDVTGRHLLTEAQVAEAAGIVESKLSLDIGTHEIYEGIAEGQTLLAEIFAALSAVQNLEESQFRHLYQALLVTWEYGLPRFAFEMFAPSFTFFNGFEPVEVLETIAGDDSIDVTDSSHVVPGESYVIWDRDEDRCTPVTVKKVLTNKRVVLYADEQISRANGVLTKRAWTIRDGAAFGKAGSIYITKPMSLLSDHDSGNLVIAHYRDASFIVEYRDPRTKDPTAWLPLGLIEHKFTDNTGFWRSVFETPGGEFIIRITCLDDVEIPHIVLMSDVISNTNTTVRTPRVADQDFTIVRFGAIYGARHTGTVFELSHDTDFTRNCERISFGPNTSVKPLWEFRDSVLNRYTMAIGDDVYWRAMYTASDGCKSRWSAVGHYTRETL